MSELIKHECGIALVRLLKPLQYYKDKYGTALYGFNKLFMLMEKQHNRGQDGAGMGCVKLNMPAGVPYMFRDRNIETNPLACIVNKQLKAYEELVQKNILDPENIDSLKHNWDFGGEVLLGHLRYATSGTYGVSVCHPYFRRSNWPTRNLMLAGNFNMTNAQELNEELITRGQHPIFETDTQCILEGIGYQLDEEHTRIYREMRDRNVPNNEIPGIISEELDPADILSKTVPMWDGGYTIGGLIGNGDAFVVRDPLGIRPGYYYRDDEVVAVASERVTLMTVFELDAEQVQEVKPGHALVIKNNGDFYETPLVKEERRAHCSFERIYFSRGNDVDIYQERKALGGALAKPIMDSVGHDLKNTIFGYIPNTAEAGYYGLMDELRKMRRDVVKKEIVQACEEGRLTEDLVDDLIMNNWPRREKIAIKDIKLRTFISQEKSRLQLASHVYDVTYGVVKSSDTLVCIDDSIVRGTTLKQSIIRILARLNPKKIIIASTCPQIRYPDCYGIDMSEVGKFIAFQATMALLKERGQEGLVKEVYEACCEQKDKPVTEMVNHVKRIYDAVKTDDISKKIAELVRPEGIDWQGELEIVFLDIEGLHSCLKEPSGDWYFTGNFPTPGGVAVLNKAFINYYENKEGRSY